MSSSTIALASRVCCSFSRAPSSARWWGSASTTHGNTMRRRCEECEKYAAFAYKGESLLFDATRLSRVEMNR